MCNCSLKNQRIQIGILYPMVPVSSQKISMPMKSCLIQFGLSASDFQWPAAAELWFTLLRVQTETLPSWEAQESLEICTYVIQPSGRLKNKQFFSLPYGRITNTYSLLTRFPIPLYLVNTWIQITLTGLPNVSLKPPHSFSFLHKKGTVSGSNKTVVGKFGGAQNSKIQLESQNGDLGNSRALSCEVNIESHSSQHDILIRH